MSEGRYDRNDGQISMEDTYVKHYMYALDRLQTCWVNETGFNAQKFNLQLLYLIRLLPDKKKQREILQNWANLLDDGTQGLGLTQDEIRAYSGMEVVTDLIMFVCDAFELINVDITGPATSKQYEKAHLVLPEFDPDKAEIQVP